MGHHHYCRICINGEKIRSIGGINKKLIENIDNNTINPFIYVDRFLADINYSITSVPIDIKNISFVFIKRHNCHHFRDIYRIDNFIYDKGVLVKHVNDNFVNIKLHGKHPFYQEIINNRDVE